MAFGSLYRIDSSVSPDGLCAISGSDIPDRTVEIWDLEKGACLRKFKGHSDAVVSVSVNPDGRRAISGSRDKTVRIWDLETGACLRTLEGHRGSVESVSVIPDGRRAISGSIDKTVRVWDLETGACPITLEDHSCEILRAVSFGKEGRRFVTVNDAEEHTDRLLEIVEAVTDERDEEDDEWEDDEVHSASVTPDNRRGVTGSSDGTVRLWDLETGACLRTLEGHGDAVHRVKVSPDGRRAISGSWDNTVRFWDLETGTCLRTGEDHANSVWIVKVSSDGRHSLSASSDKTIRLWDLKTGTCLCSFTGRNEGIWTGSVSLTPDGRYAVSGWSDQAVRLWDLGTGACLRTFEIRDCLVTSLSISPDSRYIMSGWSDWTIRLWDFKTGACLTVYHAGAAVYSVECSPNGNRVACETETGKIHLLTPVNFPPSGPLIVTAVRLWLFGEVTVKRRKPVADPGRWADHITCRCPHCGELFVPPKPVLEIGAEGAQVIRKGLWLPDSAYADPRLLAPCPHCGGALKFNPFVVDGRELG
jgi:WD40 repeat protein